MMNEDPAAETSASDPTALPPEQPSLQDLPTIAGPVLVITGPTAGGKSALAVELARRLEVPIVSLDSMKVYRRMDIGSAKPSAAKLRGVECHLIDIREPWQEFSVGDYLTELSALAAHLPRPLILAGGTAFYLNALLKGIMSTPPADRELRRRLEQRAAEQGELALHEALKQLDPESARKLHPNDRRRVVRALEVIELTGSRFSLLQQQRRPLLDARSACLIGIAHPRKRLYQRIDERVAKMFEQGWIDEVKALRESHDPAWSVSASQSIGYEQIGAALDAGEDPRDRLQFIQQRTRHFARAQLTWFRKMPLQWWSPDELELALQAIPDWLGEYERTGAWPPADPQRGSYRDM